ncbi:MAG: hypothetical protein H0U74_12325 [Bradymonadaceae bacterium]|nr:hypothetical protein [Lujinxingiaceae bacterium]
MQSEMRWTLSVFAMVALLVCAGCQMVDLDRMDEQDVETRTALSGLESPCKMPGHPSKRCRDWEAARAQEEPVDEPVIDEPVDEPVVHGPVDNATTRALWLWNEQPSTRAMLENSQGAQDAFFRFAAAPQGQPARALNRVFFEAREKSSSDRQAELFKITYDPITNASHRPALRSFVRRANAQGIAVEYLDGQAIWLATDANAAVAIKVCEDVVAFNLATPAREERLAGVHLDIEPHTVTSGPYAWHWWQDRLAQGYNAQWTAR